MRALVTGCCGFIGSFLVERLVNEGWTVEGVDDLSNSDLDSLSSLNIRPVHVDFLRVFEANTRLMPGQTLIINGDFAHENILSRVRANKYDAIFHLAACSSVPQSVELPVETHETNVFKTLGLFQAARDHVKRVIFASSAAVYGDPLPEVVSISEEHPTRPVSPYGLQKLHVEQYASMMKSDDTEFVCMRIFNVFGPRQRSGLIAEWCSKILAHKTLTIHGTGRHSRDFCYVDNVVDAFIAAATQEKVSSIYNVGNGQSVSIDDVSGHLKKAFPDITIQHSKERPGDITRSQANIDKISRELNYSPGVSFTEGLEKTLRWWRINEN